MHEGHISADGAQLYDPVVGDGPPIVVVHGGPDFDHYYLLPELDRLADSFRLVYYDQRGRGRSAGACGAGGGQHRLGDRGPRQRSAPSGSDSIAVLGHSWGGVLAMEYATRHPDRVSHLILVNTAPASAEDWRSCLRQATPGSAAGLVTSSGCRRSHRAPAYKAGNLEAEAEYYRIHFSAALRRPEYLEQVIARLRAHFTETSVLTARAIEQRLYDETSSSDGYDLIPKLQALDIPTLVTARRERLRSRGSRRPHRGVDAARAPRSCSRSVATSRISKRRTQCTSTSRPCSRAADSLLLVATDRPQPGYPRVDAQADRDRRGSRRRNGALRRARRRRIHGQAAAPVVSLHPFAVAGTGFRAGEHMRVTVRAEGAVGAQIGRRGRPRPIGVRFRAMTLGDCPTYLVSATGNKGSRAGLRSVPRPCGADR